MRGRAPTVAAPGTHLAGFYPILIPVVLVGALIFVLLYFDTEQMIRELFAWLQALGAWAPTAFVVIDMLAVILLLPGIVLTMGAGFLFGLPQGAMLVITATTLGGTSAFLIARHLFSERTTNYLRHHERLNAISDEFTPDGWKIVLLTRLIPFFPFKLSNYFFGITNFSLAHYVIGTVIGIVPNTLFIVYLGSLTADIATLGKSHGTLTPAHWLSYGFGLVVTIVAIALITRRARRALQHYLQRG